MALPLYQAQGAASSVASGIPAPGMPAHLDDDFFVLWVTCNPTNDPTVTAPSGWVAIGAVSNAATTVHLAAFGREAQSGADPAPTLQSFTGFAHAVITSYRGKAPGSSISIVATQGNNSAGVATFSSSIVTNMTDSLLVFGLGWGLDSAGPLCTAINNTTLISPTERYDAGTTDGDGGGIGVFDGQLPAALRVNGLTVNLSSASISATVAFAITSTTSVVSQPAPFFRATGTVVSSSTADITLTYPGTAQSGDLALAIIETPAGVAANLVAGQEQGFTLVGFQEGTGATNPSRHTVYKYRMPLPPGSLTGPTVDFASDHVVGAIVTYGGLVASGPEIEVYLGVDQTTSGTTYSFPDVTTLTPSALVLNIGSDGVDVLTNIWSGQTNANLAYLTERLEARTGAGNGGGFVVIEGVKGNVGATGNTTGTISNSSGGRMTLVLRSSELVSAGDGAAAMTVGAAAVGTALAIGAGSALVTVTALGVGVSLTPDEPDGMITLLPDQAQVTQRWQTTLVRCHDGTERRAAIVTKPFERLELSYKLSDDEVRYLRADLARAPAQRRLVAHPQHAMTVMADVASGTVEVDVGTAQLGLADLMVVDRDVVLIDRSSRQRQYAKVASSAAGIVTLDRPALLDFTALRTSLVPLVECTVRQPVRFSRYPQRVTIMTITLDRYHIDPVLGTGAAALTTFDGRVLLDLQIPIQRGQAPEDTDAVVDYLDYGMAVESYFSDGEAPPLGVNQRELIFTIDGAAARQRLRLFLFAVRGRQKAFLLSTFRPDLVPAVQPTGSSLIVNGTYYTDAFDAIAVYRRLRIETTDGSILHRIVLAHSDNGNGTETLTLDSDVDTGVLGPIIKISFLELLRLASDEVPWQVRVGSDTFVTLSVVGCLA